MPIHETGKKPVLIERVPTGSTDCALEHTLTQVAWLAVLGWQGTGFSQLLTFYAFGEEYLDL